MLFHVLALFQGTRRKAIQKTSEFQKTKKKNARIPMNVLVLRKNKLHSWLNFPDGTGSERSTDRESRRVQDPELAAKTGRYYGVD
jgi:hypothetical protein